MNLKHIVLAGAIGVGVLGAGGLAVSDCNYSNGDRVGYVTKFSKRGVIFKTEEGDLALALGNNQSGIGVNTWSFSVKDDNIAHQVEEAMENGRRVKLTYEQKLTQVFWRGDTDYFVTKVEYVGEDKK